MTDQDNCQTPFGITLNLIDDLWDSISGLSNSECGHLITPAHRTAMRQTVDSLKQQVLFLMPSKTCPACGGYGCRMCGGGGYVSNAMFDLAPKEIDGE